MNKTSQLELAKKSWIYLVKTTWEFEVEEAIKDIIAKYKEIVFGPGTPICMACLDELWKQPVIDQKIYDQKFMDDAMRKLAWDGLQKNAVMDGDTMIDTRAGEVLEPEVDSTCW